MAKVKPLPSQNGGKPDGTEAEEKSKNF